MSLVSQAVAKHLSLIVNFAAVLAAAWFTLGGLGYARDRVRVGAALLGFAAMLLYRAGYRLPALLVTGLTGDLVSPVSWDHHWVWIVPGAVVAGHYAAVAWRAGRKRLAWAYLAGIAAVLAVFACWPGSWLHTPKDAPYQFGLIWLPPQTSPFGPRGTYLNVDKPWFYEYHWYGLQLLTGNAYVLAGLAVARTPSDLPGNDGIYSDMFLNSPCC